MITCSLPQQSNSLEEPGLGKQKKETKDAKETIALSDIQEAGGYYRVLDVGGFSAFSDQSANSGRGLQVPYV